VTRDNYLFEREKGLLQWRHYKPSTKIRHIVVTISALPHSGFIVSCSVYYSYMLHLNGSAFCYINLLFASLCMHMTLRVQGLLRECPRAGLGALPGYPITAHHSYVFSTAWGG